jgi:hypothetical protein
MRKELEQKLVERWPTWFNTAGDIKHTLMPRGFTHDDGWFDILWRVCGNAQSHRAGLLTFEHQGCPEFERE